MRRPFLACALASLVWTMLQAQTAGSAAICGQTLDPTGARIQSRSGGIGLPMSRGRPSVAGLPDELAVIPMHALARFPTVAQFRRDSPPPMPTGANNGMISATLV